MTDFVPAMHQSTRSKYYTPLVTRWPVLTSIILALLICVGVLEVCMRMGVSWAENNLAQTQILKRQPGFGPDTSTEPRTKISISSTNGDIHVQIMTTQKKANATPLQADSKALYARTATSSWTGVSYVNPYTPTTSIPTTTTTRITTTTATEQYWWDWTSDPMTLDTTTTGRDSTIAVQPTSLLIMATTTPGRTSTPVATNLWETIGTLPSSGQRYTTESNVIFPSDSPTTSTKPYRADSGQTLYGAASETGLSRPLEPSEQESRLVYITSQIMTDSNGVKSTIVMTKTGIFTVYFNVQTVTDSTGGVATVTSMTSYYPDMTASGAPERTSSDIPNAVTPDHQRPDEVELGLVLTAVEYVRAIYVPTVIAVLLKLLWSIVFSSMKMMEPFYLLSSTKGASVKDCLISDYITSSISINGLRNLFSGHVVVILASIVYICLSFLPALAAQFSTIRALGTCDVDGRQWRCQPMWEMSIPYTRTIQGILGLVAAMIFVIMVISARRQSGVFSNPSSIATMASLLGNKEFLSELRKIPQGSARLAIADTIDHNQYVLAQYPTRSGHVRYGVVKTNTTRSSSRLESRNPYHDSEVAVPLSHVQIMQKSRSRIANRFLLDLVFILVMVALLCIIVAYSLTHGDNWFNNFFNSNPMRRFVITLMACLLDGRWKQLEREVRLMTPFRRLFQGSADPESTILVTQDATAITSIFSALRRRNFFHAFIAFVTTLSDCLLIFVGGIPWSPAQLRESFWFCTYASCSILALMILTIIALFRWRAGIEKMMMPRDPNTLVSMWLMLCNEGNKLCEDMRGYETIGSTVRDKEIRSKRARYWAGWTTEPNGTQRWVIDRERDKATLN